MTDEAMLDQLQRETFLYFLDEANPHNGLVADRTQLGAPSSIAATGFGLAIYPVGVERGFMSRAAGVTRVLTTLRFFLSSIQSREPEATGCFGFYYHFLDCESGRRAWRSEVSTIDTTFLLAGALTAAAYFDRDTPDEREIGTIASALYDRADWPAMLNGSYAVSHGWTPERGFLRYGWFGYSEALLLYVLGLGSSTHPLPAESYAAWLSTYRWTRIYGRELIYGGPLFIHQWSHLWIDFRGIQDAFVADHDLDYFENSRRATYVQQQYATRNPKGFVGYSDRCWGITASDGPGPATRTIDGRHRRFFDYVARGVPYGPDDGTIAPSACVASLPFAPEIVLPTVRHFFDLQLKSDNPYGFTATFNRTFPADPHRPYGWMSPWHVGLNQGPMVMMIENYRTGLLWQLMRRSEPIVRGLRRAGFSGGWLSRSRRRG
ncbi:MAG: glucoamylase family protein [Vicinamibacterales bacterium]